MSGSGGWFAGDVASCGNGPDTLHPMTMPERAILPLMFEDRIARVWSLLKSTAAARRGGRVQTYLRHHSPHHSVNTPIKSRTYYTYVNCLAGCGLPTPKFVAVRPNAGPFASSAFGWIVRVTRWNRDRRRASRTLPRFGTCRFDDTRTGRVDLTKEGRSEG